MNVLALVPWLVPLVLVGGYVLLFTVCGRAASLRPRRIGVLLVISAALQTGWIASCSTDRHPFWLPIATGALGLAGWCAKRVWCLKGGREPFRQLVETAAEGLRIELDATSSDRYELAAKRTRGTLRAIRCAGPFLLVVWPSAPEGRLRLLVDYLSKQYPGPFPVLRLSLSRGKE